MVIPKWKRGNGSDRIESTHLWAESIYERQVGDVLQVIERCRLRGSESQDTRPFYRLVEVTATHGAKQAGLLDDTQKDARRHADKRAAKILKT